MRFLHSIGWVSPLLLLTQLGCGRADNPAKAEKKPALVNENQPVKLRLYEGVIPESGPAELTLAVCMN